VSVKQWITTRLLLSITIHHVLRGFHGKGKI